MDDADRTASAALEVPHDLLPALHRAARLGVERATDYAEYTDEVQERIIEAARLHAVLRLGTPSVADIARLADNAIWWTELPERAPTTLSALDALYDQLSIVRELIVLRDETRRRTWPPGALEGGEVQEAGT